MERTSVHLAESQLAVIDAIKEETWSDPDLPRIDSRSELIRALLDLGIESLDQDAEIEIEDGEMSGEVVRSLIPDHELLEHRRDRLKSEAKPLFRGAKIAERFADKADELYQGEPDEKATPETVEEIGESYLAELDEHAELNILGERSVRRQKRAIRETIERYREEYNASEHAPTETMRATPEEARIGAEVKRLREQRERFVEDLRSKADTERFTNPEDLMKALAYDHGVSLDAVELVIDAITPTGTEGRHALKNGSGVHVPEMIEEIESEDEPEEIPEIPEDAEIHMGSRISLNGSRESEQEGDR
jgi:hypothetical protein